MNRNVSLVLMLCGLALIILSYRTNSSVPGSQRWDEETTEKFHDLQFSTHEGMSMENLNQEDLARRMGQLAALNEQVESLRRARERRQAWIRYGGQFLTALGIGVFLWQRTRQGGG